jgi:hypothetical protein
MSAPFIIANALAKSNMPGCAYGASGTTPGERQMEVQLGPTGLIRDVTASGAEAVRASADVVIQQIRSQMRLKFGLYALASLFVIMAGLLVALAPDGRETTSSILAAALLAIAVGCAGFGNFAIETPVVSVEAGTNASPPANGDLPINQTHRRVV